jgi:uncharacterized protein (TIGR00255 family)
MIKSMTGFATVTRDDDRATVSVTIRSVNHRYLDLQVRIPQSLAAIEAELRALVSALVTRGRVELGLALQLRQPPGVEVEFNDELGRALESALDRARAQGLVAGPLTAGDLLRVPQALVIREKPVEADEALQQALANCARSAVADAVADLDSMRLTEGQHVQADLTRRCTQVAAIVERIAAGADEGRAALELRLADRVAELRAGLQVDEGAVAQEIVRTAARSDISEEVERFRGHVSHWTTLVDAPEPCGRKLDFLLQEMNREVNTMGSKADGLRVSELVIAAKAELEKMREQVQNVE